MKKIILPILALAVPQLSQGALLVSDAFNYTAGQPLAGQGSASNGFGAAWGAGPGAGTTAGTGSTNIIVPSLSYGNLSTTGGAATTTFYNTAIFRDLGATYGGSGSNLWMSFLMQAPSNNTGVSLFSGPSTEQIFAARRSSGNYSAFIYAGATNRPLTGSTNLDAVVNPLIANASTHLYVLNIDQTAGSTPVYKVWVDPDQASLGIGSAPTTITSGSTATVNTGTQNFTFDRIRLGVFSGSSQTTTFDEFRLGQTWADVSPIPEPSSLLLLSGGALALLRRRR